MRQTKELTFFELLFLSSSLGFDLFVKHALILFVKQQNVHFLQKSLATLSEYAKGFFH